MCIVWEKGSWKNALKEKHYNKLPPTIQYRFATFFLRIKQTNKKRKTNASRCCTEFVFPTCYLLTWTCSFHASDIYSVEFIRATCSAASYPVAVKGKASATKTICLMQFGVSFCLQFCSFFFSVCFRSKASPEREKDRSKGTRRTENVPCILSAISGWPISGTARISVLAYNRK